jgi:hypothetical protein
MTNKWKLLSVAGLLIAASVALAVGVSLSTLLLVGVSLLCPAAMFLGMHGSGACHHNQEHGQAGTDIPEASKTLDTKRAA